MAHLCKQLTYLVVFLTVFLMLPAQASIAGAEEKAPAKAIAAKVNGQPIFMDQLEPRIQAGLKKFELVGSGAIPPEAKTKLQAKALEEQLIVELFYQASQQLDIPDADKKIAEEITKRKEALNAANQTIDEEILRESVRRRFYVNQYLAKHDLLDPKVPEEQIRAYYESNKKGSATKTDAVHVRHIMMEVSEEASAEEQEQARKKIEEVQQLVLKGTPFEKAAEEHSQDKATAASGGDLGYITPGYMPPEFEKVAFSLETGKISDVVKTQYGYHLIQALDFRPKGTPPKYEDTKAFFEKYLRQNLIKKKMGALVEELRAKAQIEVFILKTQDQAQPEQNPSAEPVSTR